MAQKGTVKATAPANLADHGCPRAIIRRVDSPRFRGNDHDRQWGRIFKMTCYGVIR